jgi:hypothetical protein
MDETFKPKDPDVIVSQVLWPTIQRTLKPYAEAFHAEPRYDRFRDPSEGVEEYIHLLGADVDSLTHPIVTLEIVDSFLHTQRTNGGSVSAEEELLLKAAAVCHDLGEVRLETMGVGDISFDQKNPQHEDVELQVFELLVRGMPEYQQEVFDKAYAQVVQDRISNLGKMFNACERVGYVKTAIRAFQGVDGRQMKNWKGLVGNVLMNQTEALLGYAHKYTYVREFLETNVKVIGMMFKRAKYGKLPRDRDGNICFERAKLDAAFKRFFHERTSWEVS